MQIFLTRLLRASRWGATLVLAAGCGTTVTGGGDGGGGAGGSSQTTTTGDPVDPDGNELQPTPELTCVGPVYNDDFGYHGQCCYEVHCAAPDSNGVCATPGNAQLSDLPPGSGTCECSERSGPYANSDPAAAEACCYLVGSIGCDGRPLMIGGEPRLADVTCGTAAWSGLPLVASRSGDAALDAVLARRWSERARYEHASVASFARFSMALLACGAPPALVSASQQAGADEIRHAQLALSLASVYAGSPLDLGPLDIEGAFAGAMTLEATTISTVIEACVGETLAAIEIAACAGVATAPAVREALSSIAEDETRHAELGWAFVRWAASAGGARLRAHIALAFEQAFDKAGDPPSIAPEDDLPGAASHGFLPASEVAYLRRKAIADVLRPAAAALTADFGPGRGALHSSQTTGLSV